MNNGAGNSQVILYIFLVAYAHWQKQRNGNFFLDDFRMVWVQVGCWRVRQSCLVKGYTCPNGQKYWSRDLLMPSSVIMSSTLEGEIHLIACSFIG